MPRFRLAAVALMLALAHQPANAFDDYVAESEPDPGPYVLAGAVGASAASFLAIALNVAPALEGQNPKGLGTFAVGAGIAGLGFGVAALATEDDGAGGVGAFSVALGAAALVVGIRQLTRGETSDDSRETPSADGVALAAVPFLSPGRGSGGALQLRF